MEKRNQLDENSTLPASPRPPLSILETRPMEDDRLVILYKHGYFYPIIGRFRNGL